MAEDVGSSHRASNRSRRAREMSMSEGTSCRFAVAGLEELLRIKERQLPVNRNRIGLDWGSARSGRPKFSGVYVFWWNGDAGQFLNSIRNKTLHFRGPKGKPPFAWTLSVSDLLTAANGVLPLYVGKATNIADRVGKHLKLKTLRTVSQDSIDGVCRRMTTTCQLRDRLDRLFPDIPDTRGLAVQHLMLSYVPLDSVVERFFLEDLAVGRLRPPFNVDTER